MNIQKMVNLIAGKGGVFLKNKQDETSEGLNQIFEIINAKGDTGELEQIMEQYGEDSVQQQENPTE